MYLAKTIFLTLFESHFKFVSITAQKRTKITYCRLAFLERLTPRLFLDNPKTPTLVSELFIWVPVECLTFVCHLLQRDYWQQY